MQPVSEVRDFLEQLGYEIQIAPTHSELVALWEQWYRGKVDSFHDYEVYNGTNKVRLTKKSLGLAKKACEDWADLILNEKVTINVDASKQDILTNILSDNKFQAKGNKLIEKTFALGLGAFVVYKDDKKKNGVSISYNSYKKIYPLRFIDDELIDVAFASEISTDKYYVNIHTRDDVTGRYTIENVCFVKNKQTKDFEVETIPGVMAKYTSEIPLFQCIFPNTVNNDEIDSPMPLSVFANASDEMKDCDEKFDSYFNEFRTGKKRIFIDPSLMTNYVDTNGAKLTKAFDEQDIAFYGANLSGSNKKIETTEFDIRAEQHSQGLQDGLNLFADKVGFGPNHYIFRDGKVYTNTSDIISSNSKMFRRLKKHEQVIENAIKGLVKAALYINTNTLYDGDINIDFDDSIIIDKEAEKKQYMSEVAAGLMSGVEYRMKVYGEDKETAQKMIPEQANVME